MTTISDKPVGRPSKLTAEFLAAAHEVINHEDNALIFTDAELLFAINEKLSPEAKICTSTFQKWKAGKIEDDTEGKEFLRLIEKSLQKQKTLLFSSLKTEEKDWKRWAWIIERKFSEWNLKQNIGITKTEDGAAALAAVLLGGDEPKVDGDAV